MAEQRRELGNQIRAARLGKGWKQKQLAAAVHVEPDTVSRWENGRHAPDIDTLERIAETTGRPISFFVREVSPGDSRPRMEALLERAIVLLEEMLAGRPAPRQPESGAPAEDALEQRG